MKDSVAVEWRQLGPGE